MPKYKLVRVTTVPVSLYTLLDGQLSFMNAHYNVVGISSKGELLESVAKKEGIAVKSVEMTRRISPLKDLKAVWTLYKFFKKEKPLIVHTHTPKAGTIGMLAAKIAGVPLRLHTIAGLPLLEAKGNKRKLLNWVEKATYACATNIYPNSYGLKEVILKEGFCEEKKLRVIGAGSSNGIDTSYFSSSHFSEDEKLGLKSDLKIQSNDFVFVFVGRMVSDKGINELVVAFSQIYEENSHVKLLLVGEQEPDLDPLMPKTKELINLHPGIIITGYRPDVRPYFAISDVLAFPSYREGFPNVVMQGGAMGLPSIVSDINGCNEIIVEGRNGIIIPSKNIQALTNAMKKLLRDKDLRYRLKNNARRMINERYEQKVIWEALLAEYKRLEGAI